MLKISTWLLIKCWTRGTVDIELNSFIWINNLIWSTPVFIHIHRSHRGTARPVTNQPWYNSYHVRFRPRQFVLPTHQKSHVGVYEINTMRLTGYSFTLFRGETLISSEVSLNTQINIIIDILTPHDPLTCRHSCSNVFNALLSTLRHVARRKRSPRGLEVSSLAIPSPADLLLPLVLARAAAGRICPSCPGRRRRTPRMARMARMRNRQVLGLELIIPPP